MYAGYDIRCIIYEEICVLAIMTASYALWITVLLKTGTFCSYTNEQTLKPRDAEMVGATHFRKMHLAFLLNEETVCWSFVVARTRCNAQGFYINAMTGSAASLFRLGKPMCLPSINGNYALKPFYGRCSGRYLKGLWDGNQLSARTCQCTFAALVFPSSSTDGHLGPISQ